MDFQKYNITEKKQKEKGKKKKKRKEKKATRIIKKKKITTQRLYMVFALKKNIYKIKSLFFWNSNSRL